MRLEGKRAIVTGGARGIGEAIVRRFAEEGAQVAVFDVDDAGGPAVVSSLEDGRAVFHRCDITVEDDVEAATAEVLQTFGGIDVLVNNAGVNAYFDAATMTEKDWDAVFAVDLKGAWLCAKHALPALRASGRGAIVNIASIHAQLTINGMFPYAAAKAGLVGLTRSLALDYAPDNVRVNAVCPGWTRTHLVEEWFSLQADPGAAERSILDVHPLGRIATPAEIANIVAFIASDEASFVTGAALAVDGGLSARFAT